MSLSRRHDLADYRSDDVHFFGIKPIPSRKVARFTGRSDVAFDVGQCVINSIKPTRAFCGVAVDARLNDQSIDFVCCEVAGIYSFISLAKKDSAPLVASSISPLPFSNFKTLLSSHLIPAIRAVITPLLTSAMAWPTLIRNSPSAAFIRAKVFGCSWQRGLASMACSHVGTVVLPHTKIKCWRLPWSAYP